MQTDILIVGGGLSGLALADKLERAGRDWRLVEATDRFGGRILSPIIHGQNFDLGPAWFWPGQPRMAELVRRFGHEVFEQFGDGMLVYQDAEGGIHPNRGLSSMQCHSASGRVCASALFAPPLSERRAPLFSTRLTLYFLLEQNKNIMPQLVKQNGAVTGALAEITPNKHGVVAIGGEIELARGRVHEALGDAGEMFALAAAYHSEGPMVWIGLGNDVGSLSPTGFQQFLEPMRVIIVSCVTRQEVLWATEQALRTPGAGCVIAELADGPDLQISRRLQIAAEEGGALGIMLIAGRAHTSAAQTRWVCEACDDDTAQWVWRLTKNKSGNVGAWRAGWSPSNAKSANGRSDDAPGIVLMAAAAAA